MTDRGNQVVGELIRRINGAIAELDVTYGEYQAAKQWLIEVGEAGEWPLLLDVFVEHAVEVQAYKERSGSEGTILGPYYVPDAPVLESPFELPHRPNESGERLRFTGRVLSSDRTPLAGAELDIWHADADGLYSGFSEIPAGILRGKVITDAAGCYEVRTIAPAPYTIPHEGPTGRMIAACGWHPWRPAHLHLIVRAAGHEDLITQLFPAGSEYLNEDVADAVKESLIVRPERQGDELVFQYDFALASVRAPATVA